MKHGTLPGNVGRGAIRQTSPRPTSRPTECCTIVRMKIPNSALLDEYRQPGPCELCQRWAAVREPHHLRSKGMGGCPIDIRINLISLGGTILLDDGHRRFSCACHRRYHDGHISAASILAVVAKREQTTPEVITEVMDWMRRLIKPTPHELARRLVELSGPAQVVATRELVEAGILDGL